jgi:NAD(P)-dependent dehydrogenase (short-subunit alcohol dehydrogenase family)
MNLFRLDGRIALVTGGAGNVGRPIVRALAEAGATVLLASRNEAKCNAYAAELAGEGLQVEGERCDLASESDIRALRDRILERHGRLDVLFNNSLFRADAGAPVGIDRKRRLDLWHGGARLFPL